MSVAVALVAIAVTLVAAGLAVFGYATQRYALALPALIPVATGLVVRAGGIDVDLPGRPWVVVLSASVLLLGVVAGGPLSMWVLDRTATPPSSPPPPPTPPPAPGREALRGGATIGYLERIAVVAAWGVGSWEIVAGVIAIKGLGRFTELTESHVREKFIIGTLVSLVWAGFCGGLVFAGR
jgi:hypothetical protein